MIFFDAPETARLLNYSHLMTILSDVLREYDRREIVSPERLVVPCGEDGLLLSMPCHAADIVVHKLLSIYRANPGRLLPAIQGSVTCLDSRTGTPLFCLDGPTVTARRTAAVTMLGVRRLRPTPPRSVLIIGTGAQARAHVEGMLEVFPDAAISVRGHRPGKAAAFCNAFGKPGHVIPEGDAADQDWEVVVAVTSSSTPVYDEPAHPDRLVIGAGAYRLDMVEIGSRVITDSQVYVDDIVGAPVEAGDVVAAGQDWTLVRPLATALAEPPDFSRPIFLKSVGCAAWDLAACRAAQASLTLTGAASLQKVV
jgi:1-piperideine-2-carboxylate/1-pyrroline-2-carboxylate reductase [NAD(P)H]